MQPYIPCWGGVPPPDPRSSSLGMDPIHSSSLPTAGLFHCGRRNFGIIQTSSQNSKKKINPEPYAVCCFLSLALCPHRGSGFLLVGWLVGFSVWMNFCQSCEQIYLMYSQCSRRFSPSGSQAVGEQHKVCVKPFPLWPCFQICKMGSKTRWFVCSPTHLWNSV